MIEGLAVKDPQIYICVPKPNWKTEEKNIIFLSICPSCCITNKKTSKNKTIPCHRSRSRLYKNISVFRNKYRIIYFNVRVTGLVCKKEKIL